MRVALLTEPAGGGVGRHLIDLATGLKRRGHHVSVVYSPLRAERWFLEELQEVAADDVTEVSMARSVGFRDIKSALALWRWFRSRPRFDVVHAHSSKAGALARLVAPRCARLIYTPHAIAPMNSALGPVQSTVYGAIERWLGRVRTDVLVAVSNAEADVCQRLGIPRRLIRVIPNGVATANTLPRKEARRSLELGDGRHCLMWVGRFSEQKDPLRFVRIVAALTAIDVCVDALMVGSGELEPEVRSEIERRGLTDTVRIVAHPKARMLMRAADILVMTSRYESMPYVAIEALASGTPVFATDAGGIKEIVDPSVGTLFPLAASDGDIAAAIRQALQSSLLGEMASRAPRFAVTIEQMIDRTEEVYEGG